MKELKPEHHKAISMLLMGSTHNATANACGCSRSTLDRWLHEPLFVEAYQLKMKDLNDAMQRKVQRLARESIDGLLDAHQALRALIESPDTDRRTIASAANTLVREGRKWIDKLQCDIQPALPHTSNVEAQAPAVVSQPQIVPATPEAAAVVSVPATTEAPTPPAPEPAASSTEPAVITPAPVATESAPTEAPASAPEPATASANEAVATTEKRSSKRAKATLPTQPSAPIVT